MKKIRYVLVNQEDEQIFLGFGDGKLVFSGSKEVETHQLKSAASLDDISEASQLAAQINSQTGIHLTPYPIKTSAERYVPYEDLCLSGLSRHTKTMLLNIETINNTIH